MEELSKVIAQKLVWINDQQIARWGGLTGDDFREATRAVLGEIIVIEELLESRGIDLQVIHSEGTLFRFAYWGTLFCSRMADLSKQEKVRYIESWVFEELMDATVENNEPVKSS